MFETGSFGEHVAFVETAGALRIGLVRRGLGYLEEDSEPLLDGSDPGSRVLTE